VVHIASDQRDDETDEAEQRTQAGDGKHKTATIRQLSPPRQRQSRAGREDLDCRVESPALLS
jgi:hypothetical protein